MSSDGDAWLVHAAAVLRGAGVRASPGRAAVTQVLARGGCLMSAQDIQRRLEADAFSASQSTVYRTLDLLHEHGLLRRIDAGEGLARYEPADPSGNDAHQHVVFGDGRVEPFTDARLTRAMAGLGKRLGLEVDGYELIVHARGSSSRRPETREA
jgi:Fur family transcriptional regulator, ferric uptake regulator